MLQYITLSAAVFATAHAVSAEILTYSGTFDSSDFSISIPNPETEHSPVFSFSIEQFDPALGTLNSVTFAFEFTFRFVGNTGENGGGLNFGGGGNFYISGYDDSIYGNGGGTSNGGEPNTDLDFGFTIGPQSGALGQFANPAFVNEHLLGTGSRSISFALFITLDVNSIGSTTGLIELSSGYMSVNYDYTPSAIPEPSTFAALAGLGVLGCVAARRPRRSVA